MASANNPIEIDDGSTASDTDAERPTHTPKKLLKRKLSVESIEEKVEWTDDSDGEYERLKKRKRRSTGRGRIKADIKGKGKAVDTTSTTAQGKRGRRPAGAADEAGAASGKGRGRKKKVEEEDDDIEIPTYYKQRRREFDKNREVLREAGLRLPPDYSDIYFSDDERLAELQERPKFDIIKPSRPYKDVELEYSAGLIPASIAQYLRDYQITGVKFLHRLFVYQKGGILGDDMGLGKTVQVAAFLTAAFGKTGDERDAKRMRKMRRAGGDSDDRWYPRVLIVCPGSLIQNWKNEVNRWGWWHVDLYHGSGKDDVLQAARAGRLEIMVTTYVTYKNHREKINTIRWDAVVADECHVLKERASETTKAMDEINALCRIGLTGTAIQNKYEELWTLLNWTNPGHFGSIAEWRHTICRPLTIGQSHDATLYQLSLARKTAKKLVQNLLPEFFLRRMKSLIAHQLPKKTDKVVFCPLTKIQREAYENFINSEEVEILRSVSDPCPCGSGTKKGWCCHATLPSGRSWHEIVFPAIQTLMKLSNHLTLLIPTSDGLAERQERGLKTLQTCVPDGWEELYRQRDSLLTLSNPEFCGKWNVLRKLLRFWHGSGDKVLVFSHNVRLLRILQHLFHNTSYNVSYLDGSLSYEERQRAVDDFNADPAQFVFLISTKAGGVGLNITSANKVVIFDPHWNPSYDLQAQDRAYRIGQVRDVDVFRLVSAGTIEEIVYARQIYKQQQANIGYSASTERRYFRGVQQDRERKGEIFGLGNLFAFHADQVVLRDIVNKTNIAEAKAGVHLTDIDIDKVVKDEEEGVGGVAAVKKEEAAADDEDGGLSQFAALLTSENQEEALRASRAAAGRRPQSDAVQAILASAGVEYTHENSEVVGSSRVEEQLSRRAEEMVPTDDDEEEGGEGGGGVVGDPDHKLGLEEGGGRVGHGGIGDTILFADDGEYTSLDRLHLRLRYNPPPDVMRRQFCSMARHLGFPSATDFALVVESWTQEQRRACLEAFYRAREARLLELEGEGEGVGKKDEDGDGEVKVKEEEMKDETDDDDDDEVLIVEPAVKWEKTESTSPSSGHSPSMAGAPEIKTKAEIQTPAPMTPTPALEKKPSLPLAGGIFLPDTDTDDDDDDETDEL